MSASRRALPDAPNRRGWCPGLARPMPTGDGLLARIHPPLGILTVAQLRAVAAAATRFGNGHVDVTARANLQLRGVTEVTRSGLVKALESAGLGDARSDGGPQRLTLTSPLAGLSPAPLDVPALARTIEAQGLAVAGLPAKTLVLIEGGGATDLPGIAADIHVRADMPGCAAIGLAEGDGIVWIATLPESQIAEAVASLLRAFATSGRRRVRDLETAERAMLIAALSVGNFRGALERRSPLPRGEGQGKGCEAGGLPALVADASDRSGTVIDRHPHAFEAGSHVAPTGPDSRAGYRLHTSPKLWDHPPPSFRNAAGEPGTQSCRGGRSWHRRRRLIPGSAPQPREDGIGAGGKAPRSRRVDIAARAGARKLASSDGSATTLRIEAPFGRCTAAMLGRLADVAASLGTDEIRISSTRGFVLPIGDGPAARRSDHLADLSAAGFVTTPNDPRRAIAACPGAPACASGSTPTGADGARLAEAFRPFAADGMTAHVSGCAKGCAHPGRADLTLVGREGGYGIVLDGTPGDAPALELTFEAALERVRRAKSGTLAQAFGNGPAGSTSRAGSDLRTTI